jgi:lipoate-protein ligase A
LKLIDLTFHSPEENLACDEALLELCEEGSSGEVLRFWESERYFVVLGSSNKVHDEVSIEACKAEGIPILRRHSGGGTVVQGPGCLNYALILQIDPHGSTCNITETTNYVMRRHAETLSDLLHEKVEVKGSSDLVISGKKYSGNAQRRKLKALLFHGTFLYDFDIERIEMYLKIPAKQPLYRDYRTHANFVTNIKATPAKIKDALMQKWGAADPFTAIPHERIFRLVSEKYVRSEWNFKL